MEEKKKLNSRRNEDDWRFELLDYPRHGGVTVRYIPLTRSRRHNGKTGPGHESDSLNISPLAGCVHVDLLNEGFHS